MLLRRTRHAEFVIYSFFSGVLHSDNVKLIKFQITEVHLLKLILSYFASETKHILSFMYSFNDLALNYIKSLWLANCIEHTLCLLRIVAEFEKMLFREINWTKRKEVCVLNVIILLTFSCYTCVCAYAADHKMYLSMIYIVKIVRIVL